MGSVQLRQYFYAAPPEVRLGVNMSVAEWLSVEPYVRLGGFSIADFGLTGTLALGNRMGIILQYEMFESHILASSTTGQAFSIGGMLRL